MPGIIRFMRIPTHQIHNVLNAYARQLRDRQCSKDEDGKAAPGAPYAMPAEKRDSIIDKITADIIRRLTKNEQNEIAPEAGDRPRHTGAEGYRLTFYTYTEDKEKIIKTIEIRDSQFLSRKKGERGKL